MPPLVHVSAPHIIGRERELATVDAFLAARGGALLISGDAGIGKSRLARETVVRAAERGYRVVKGACFERDQTLPYAPILDLIRAEVASQPHEGWDRLKSVAPGYLRLLPGSPPAKHAVEIASDAERERRRLLHEGEALLAHLATAKPLLVVIEDIHWSDEASFDLLLHLSRVTHPSPLALMMTYRSDEPSPGLSRFLAELDRRRGASEIALSPLPAAAVGQQLRAMLQLPRPPGAVFVRSLHGLTGGNPFFVEEVLRSLIAEGTVFLAEDGWQRKPLDQLRIPRSVAHAVSRRTALLTPTARDLLILAAVAGRRVDFALLQAVSGLEEATVLSGLKELITAQLLVEVSADHFAFRHALIQQAVSASLLQRERRILHARMAQAVERGGTGGGEASVEDLAYHHFAAGHWDAAVQLARAAGDRAQALYAPHAAAEHYSRALSAASHLGTAPDAALYRARGQAFDALGDFAAARADYEAALARAEEQDDAAMGLAALLDLGFLWSGRDYQQALSWLLRGVALARKMDDPQSLARALNRLGNWHANHDEIDDALRCHDEALAICERLNDRRGLAETLDLLAMTHGLGGEFLAGHHAASRAAALFAELGDRQGLAGVFQYAVVAGTIFETETLARLVDVDTGRGDLERGLALARDIDWRSGEAYLLAVLGEVHAVGGEFGTALAHLRDSIAIAEELDHRQWIIQARWGLARLFGTMLAAARERQELERILALSREIHSRVWINTTAAGLASSLVALSEADAAEALLAEALTAETPMRTLGQRLLWMARAELAMAREQPRQALAIINRLYGATINLRSEADIPRLAQIKATALAAIGETSQAEELLRSAQITAAQVPAPPTLRLLHLTLAEVLHALERDDEAMDEEAAARTLAERLAATIPEGDLHDEYLLATGLSLATRQEDPAPTSLTPRELEVANQIAAGRSNREIASALFVSERTVETHVANILRKLAVPTRAGIAAWVERQGLTPSRT